MQFIICNGFICILTGIILTAKHYLQRHTTVNSRYLFWYFYLAMISIPFLPLGISDLSRRIQGLFSRSGTLAAGSLSPSVFSDASVINRHWVEDIFVSSQPGLWQHLGTLLLIVWVCGMLCTAGLTLACCIRLFNIQINSFPVSETTHPQLYTLYRECCAEMKLSGRCRLLTSCRISSPVTYGIFRPKILVPEDIDLMLSEKELHCILLHELQHCRQKDAWSNVLICIFRILYWFNPLVHLAFRQFETDRESACDYAVISHIGSQQHLEYAQAIIRFADQMLKRTAFSPVSGIGQKTSQMKKRILLIASYETAPARKKQLTAVLLAGFAFLVFLVSPLLTVSAGSSSGYQPDSRQVQTTDLSAYFQGYQGTFVLYDQSKDQYQIYNQKLSQKRFSPDSTYKAAAALLALNAGVITPKDSLRSWDNSPQPYESWNQDQTLTSAMQNSVNWYFQNLDAQTGAVQLLKGYRELSYGNGDISGGLNSYWMESTLKISPLEQVNFLRNLYCNEWGYKEENIQAVKQSLFLSQESQSSLYGKTGSGKTSDSARTGWFIGYVEQSENIYFFAAHIEDKDSASGSTAQKIVQTILKDYGIFQ